MKNLPAKCTNCDMYTLNDPQDDDPSCYCCGSKLELGELKFITPQMIKDKEVETHVHEQQPETPERDNRSDHEGHQTAAGEQSHKTN